MQKHIRELDGIPEETERLAVEAIEDVDEGAPLLRDFSDNSDENLDARSLSP